MYNSTLCVLQILQTVYFGYCVINDVFGSNVKPWEDQGKRSFLQRLRDGAAASIVFPMGCVSGQLSGGNTEICKIWQF